MQGTIKDFKEGDRIVVTKQWGAASPGMVGTIINAGTRPGWGIRFDNEFKGSHDCGGLCEYSRGHYVIPSNFKLYEGVSSPFETTEDRNILHDEHPLKEGDVVISIAPYVFGSGARDKRLLVGCEYIVSKVYDHPQAQIFSVVGSTEEEYYTFNTEYFKLKEKGDKDMHGTDNSSGGGIAVNPDIAREFGESKEANKMLLVNKHFGKGDKLFSFLMDEVLGDKRAKLIEAAEKLEAAELARK